MEKVPEKIRNQLFYSVILWSWEFHKFSRLQATSHTMFARNLINHLLRIA